MKSNEVGRGLGTKPRIYGARGFERVISLILALTKNKLERNSRNRKTNNWGLLYKSIIIWTRLVVG